MSRRALHSFMVENESKFCVGDPKNVHLKQMDEAWENMHLFRADVLDYDTLTRALEGCEGVFHLATQVPEDKIVDPELEVLAPALKGTSNVLKACSAMKVQKVIVLLPTTAVHHVLGPCIITPLLMCCILISK